MIGPHNQMQAGDLIQRDKDGRWSIVKPDGSVILLPIPSGDPFPGVTMKFDQNYKLPSWANQDDDDEGDCEA